MSRRSKKNLTKELHEEIVQTFLLTGNKSETARRLNISMPTVYNHLKKESEAVKDPDLLMARRKATIDIAGKVSRAADQVISSISSVDLETGTIKHHDAQGNITKVVTYGPSLMQKVTAGAILVDKLKVLRETEQLLDDARDNSQLLLPSNVTDLVSGIRGKLKSLSILKADFAEDRPGLTERVQDALEQAETVEEAEVLDLDSFDGNH